MGEEGRKKSIKERLSAIGKRIKGQDPVEDNSTLAPTEEILIPPAQPENEGLDTVLLTEDPMDPVFSVEYEITYIHTDEKVV